MIDFTNIENEKKVIVEIETLIKELESATFKDKDYNEILVGTYNSRASKVTKKFRIYPSDSLSNFIESIYTKALSIKPDDNRTTYNFGTFYYNQAVDMANSLPTNLSKKETKKAIKKIKNLFLDICVEADGGK